MTDPTKVDAQIIDVINQLPIADQLPIAATSPQVILSSGAGKAYQSVARSAAIAVQDAGDTLRKI